MSLALTESKKHKERGRQNVQSLDIFTGIIIPHRHFNVSVFFQYFLPSPSKIHKMN